MSIGYLTCEHCGKIFADCGDYVGCSEECGIDWCSEECADADGHKYAHCNKFDENLDDDIYEPCYECEEENCENCEHFTPESCKYCREEDFDNDILFSFALKNLLGITKEELVRLYKNR